MKKILRHFFKRYNNAHGQVLVEYILFSILALTLIGAFMKAFRDANFNYLERVFGGGPTDYLGCLLREGQLPQLGSEAGPGACPPIPFEFDGEDIPEYPAPPIPAAPRLSDAVIPPAPVVPLAPDIPRPPPIPPPPPLSSGSNTPAGAGDLSSANDGEGSTGLSEGIGAGNNRIIPISASADDLGGGGGGNGDQFSGQGKTLRRKAGALIPIESKKDGAKKSLLGGALTDSNNRRNIQGSRVIELSEREKQELAANTKTAIFQQGMGSALKKRVVPLAENKFSAPVEDEGWDWNLGVFIKYLVVIAILLLILLLIGGQFLQIKKGLEGAR